MFEKHLHHKRQH